MARRTALTLLLCAIAGAPLASSVEAGDRFDEALKAYQEALREDALVRRTQGRARLATTRDKRAMEILAKDYGSPEAPEAQVRYLIAHISSRYFEDREWVTPYQAWLDQYTKPHDAWLWFLGRSVHAKYASDPDLIDPVDPKLCAYVRAAALEASATAKRSVAAQLIHSELDALGKAKGVERGVILGSLAAIARSMGDYLDDEDVQPALKRLIDAIDAKATPDWAALTIARQFAALLDMPKVTLQTPYLHSILEGRSNPASDDDDKYGRPTFMGLEASGKRICYVIDCSDSMLTPLTDEERGSLRKPAITGEDPKEAKKRSLEDELDWKKIKTRFDLAREYLKLSLLGLTKDQSFAIVCFGTDAKLLDGTKGMAVAKKGNVKKAIKALDKIRPGPATETRVHGTLMGNTNFQAAFMTAFGVTTKGVVEDNEYVHPKGFTEGCDTIFFLSDGRPTEDNWPGEGPMTGPGGYRDRETGKRIEPPAGGGGQGPQIHPGPYADGGFYLDGEIQRMNLLRKAEIHCIGIGEAQKWQLQTIAKMGLGKVRMVGTDDEDDG